MIITICGSSAFKKQMSESKQKLKSMGHEVIVHPWYENGKMDELAERVKKEHAVVKKQFGFIKWYHDAICKSDAILVLNFDKNGVKNYVGGNTLMEIGFAHVNNKKVFLLNPIPKSISYSDEIEAMVDQVIDGDLSKIK